jgi:DNA-directed RNA polymerase specialized sigma24 family protein
MAVKRRARLRQLVASCDLADPRLRDFFGSHARHALHLLCMEGIQQWGLVLRQARHALRRYGDASTREAREDIAQEAAILAWQWSGRLNDQGRLGAAVRTITRRHRTRSLVAEKRRGWLRYVDFGAACDAEPRTPQPDGEQLCVGGRYVSLAWVKQRLARVLARLSPLDQRLLLGFYEGFCCAELATRFGRSEDCVKTRIHRARRRVRGLLEGLARSPDEVAESEIEEER